MSAPLPWCFARCNKCEDWRGSGTYSYVPLLKGSEEGTCAGSGGKRQDWQLCDLFVRDIEINELGELER